MLTASDLSPLGASILRRNEVKALSYFMGLPYKSITGTATYGVLGQLSDLRAPFGLTDEQTGRILLIIDGPGKGEFYHIIGNTNATVLYLPIKSYNQDGPGKGSVYEIKVR